MQTPYYIVLVFASEAEVQPQSIAHIGDSLAVARGAFEKALGEHPKEAVVELATVAAGFRQQAGQKPKVAKVKKPSKPAESASASAEEAPEAPAPDSQS